MDFNKIRKSVRNFTLKTMLKTNFNKQLLLLMETEKIRFELGDLKEILKTNDEKYLLSFARDIKEKCFGKYNSSDCTVESLTLDTTNIEEYLHNIIKNELYVAVPITISIISLVISILK